MLIIDTTLVVSHVLTSSTLSSSWLSASAALRRLLLQQTMILRFRTNLHFFSGGFEVLRVRPSRLRRLFELHRQTFVRCPTRFLTHLVSARSLGQFRALVSSHLPTSLVDFTCCPGPCGYGAFSNLDHFLRQSNVSALAQHTQIGHCVQGVRVQDQRGPIPSGASSQYK